MTRSPCPCLEGSPDQRVVRRTHADVDDAPVIRQWCGSAAVWRAGTAVVHVAGRQSGDLVRSSTHHASSTTQHRLEHFVRHPRTVPIVDDAPRRRAAEDGSASTLLDEQHGDQPHPHDRSRSSNQQASTPAPINALEADGTADGPEPESAVQAASSVATTRRTMTPEPPRRFAATSRTRRHDDPDERSPRRAIRRERTRAVLLTSTVPPIDSLRRRTTPTQGDARPTTSPNVRRSSDRGAPSRPPLDARPGARDTTDRNVARQRRPSATVPSRHRAFTARSSAARSPSISRTWVTRCRFETQSDQIATGCGRVRRCSPAPGRGG